MTVLIVGGASSGKSAYGEQLACQLAGDKPKIYIATMASSSHPETVERIAAHRFQRQGKGFATLEKEAALRELSFSGEDTVLVECLSNLLANEMYQAGKEGQEAAKEITADLLAMSEQCENLVVISNDIFEDSFLYEKDTQEYIDALGWINAQLAAEFNMVTEVVYGIACHHKGGKSR